jgi:hypothetical protein
MSIKEGEIPDTYQDDEFMLSLEREQRLPTSMHGQPSPQMEQVTVEDRPSVRQD